MLDLTNVGSNKASASPGIDSRKILYPKGKNDECITPPYGVEPILRFVPSSLVVWCPFDTAASQYVRMLRKQGNRVILSHKNRGQDFLKWEPKEYWDVIVSNPPFTGKREIFERALSFGKPFALLMSIVWLNDTTPKVIFEEARAQMQLLLLDKRIRFDNADGRPNDDITFNTSYYCRGMLPRDIVTVTIEIPKKPKSPKP